VPRQRAEYGAAGPTCWPNAVASGPASLAAAAGGARHGAGGSFLIGWRGVGGCLQRELGGGQGASGAASRRMRRRFGGGVRGGLLHLAYPSALRVAWVDSAAAAAGARVRRASICCRAPVAMLLGLSSGQWPHHVPARRGVGAALGRRASRCRAVELFAAAAGSAPTSWWRRSLWPLWPLASSPVPRCP